MLALSEYSLTRLDTVHCCTAETLLNALPTDYVDLIVTSPPYDNLRTYNGFTWDFERIACESYRVLKPGGVLVWVVGDATIDGSETLTSFRQALYFKDVVGFKMHDTMIWDKPGTTPPHKPVRYANAFEFMFVFSKGTAKTTNVPLRPFTGNTRVRGRRRQDGSIRYDVSNIGGAAERNIWRVAIGSANNDDRTDHPAMFPEKLAERHILTWSNPGDVVLDYFMGSGTTAKMARKIGRHFIGCDISQEYVQIARQRLAMPYTLPMFETLPLQATVNA